MNNAHHLFYIWSYEHAAWWRAGEEGYTRDIAEAGRYSESRARFILMRANQFRPPEDPHEVLVPQDEVSEFLETLGYDS